MRGRRIDLAVEAKKQRIDVIELGQAVRDIVASKEAAGSVKDQIMGKRVTERSKPIQTALLERRSALRSMLDPNLRDSRDC